MGKAIDAALAHYHALGNPFIEVPEWRVPDEAAIAAGKEGATKPLRIYYQPLTLLEREQLEREINEDNFIGLLIAKALDENGQKLFEIADEPVLKRAVSSHVIQRAAVLITSLPKMSVEDARKN